MIAAFQPELPMFRTLLKAAFLLAALATSGAAAAQQCLDEESPEAVQTYVDQCLEVSPATRPPCNGENPCQMIWDEIARGCGMLGEDAPAFCSDYL